MTKASMQVQMRQFNHIPLDKETNELGTLARVFTQMSRTGTALFALRRSCKRKRKKLRQTNCTS